MDSLAIFIKKTLGSQFFRSLKSSNRSLLRFMVPSYSSEHLVNVSMLPFENLA
jgi:hypothetical protein